MGTNAELVELFEGIADLLDLAGEKFKPEAYRRAARSIESLTEDVRRVADRGELRTVPGVGEAIEEKIREYLRDGQVHYYEKLKGQFPPGLVELMQLPGLGPKTARRFWLELKVEGPTELRDAIDAGRLSGMKGFGARKIELIRTALTQAAPPKGRTPLLQAWELASTIVATLRRDAPVDQVEVAGSLRRRRETVGDLDILATSREPEKVFDVFSALPSIAAVVLRGPTKETVLLEGGIQVDLRVVEPAAFGAALQYFTGSKDHNVRLRTLARDMGLKVNEYGVVRGEERVAGATEEEVYRALGLPWIPSEIRENVGEIEAAAKGALPRLVEPTDVKGDLHLHLDPRASPADVDGLLSAASHRGWSYLGIVVSSTAGGHAERLAPDLEAELLRRRAGPDRGIRVLLADETDAPGSEPPGPQRDLVIVRPSATGAPPPPLASSGPQPILAAHLSVRGSSEEADPERLRPWLHWAKDHGIALEVAPTAPTDGVDSGGARRANGMDIRLHAGSGATRAAELDRSELAVGLLRRAWVPPTSVVNATTWSPRPLPRRSHRPPPKR